VADVVLACMAGTDDAISDTAAETRVYVAPDGDDEWSGEYPEPVDGGDDGPFATIEGAQAAVRKLKADGGLERRVRVSIRGGTYRLDEPVAFAPEDSGTEKCPVIYEAYPGEKPVFSGGREIGDWEQTDDDRWVADLPAVREDEWWFRQLWVDGERRSRPRYPKEGYLEIDELADPEDPDADRNWRAFRYQPGDLDPDWEHLEDVEILKFFGWDETRRSIASIDPDERVVTVDGPVSGGGNRNFTWFGDRYCVENVREALEEPGEWYLDREAGRLEYLPDDGEAPDSTTVIAPALDHLLRLEGTADGEERVEHLTFEGLTFTHSQCVPAEGYSERQSDVFVPGAVRATGTRHVRFEENDFAHLGTYALEFEDACQDNHVCRNHFHDLAGGGIKIGGPKEPETAAAETRSHVVSDNRIEDAGHVFLSSAGIWVGHSGHHRIVHNAISDLRGTGISLGWTWSPEFTPARDIFVAYNHVYDLGKGVMGGASGIYTLAMQPGTILRNNYIHDLERFRGAGGAFEDVHPAFGFQVDDGCGKVRYEDNVVHDVPDACFKQMGREHIVRNNVFARSREAQVLRRSGEGSLLFENNVVFGPDGRLFEGYWDRENFELANNCFWAGPDAEASFDGHTLAEWQTAGHDEGSIVADPRFVDPDAGDFSLEPDSPAFDLGFEPISLDAVGPRDE
jgi:hypothetical protein